MHWEFLKNFDNNQIASGFLTRINVTFKKLDDFLQYSAIPPSQKHQTLRLKKLASTRYWRLKKGEFLVPYRFNAGIGTSDSAKMVWKAAVALAPPN